MASTKLIVAGQTVRDLCLQETGSTEGVFAFAERLLELGLLAAPSLDALPSGTFDPAAFADLVVEPIRVNRWNRTDTRIGQGPTVASGGGGGEPEPLRGIGYDRVGIDNDIL